MRRTWTALAALPALCLLGCAPKIPPWSGGSRLSLRVAVADQANGNAPIPFDLVVVGDKKLAQSVAALDSAAWYSQKKQFINDFPDTRRLSVMEWEWTPGQIIPQIDLNLPKKTAGVFAFARYAAPGAHRLQLRPNRPLTVQLALDGPRLMGGDPGKGLSLALPKK